MRVRIRSQARPGRLSSKAMAKITERLPDNAPGDLYVDRTCIDCATCRIVAPASFASHEGGTAIVHRQPADDAEWTRALMALVACPTSSIGTASRRDARAAARAFPEPVEGVSSVLYCGYADESSFGASSYLLLRPEGNVLVDCPRPAGPLLARIEELGGVRTIFLTHRDDVAQHAALARRFGAERVLHAGDLTAGTRDVERRIEGAAPVTLAPDLLAIPVPGHTRGSMALLSGDVLWSGDHLWASERSGRLRASRDVCWYSWEEQLRSLEALLANDFRVVLPGHGMRYLAASVADARRELRDLLVRLAR